MDQDFKEFVDRCFEVSARKEDISRDDIIRMLGVCPDSEECGYLGSRARELAAIKSKNKATLGTPFGVDYVPCDASCRFCSFGTRWGLMEGQSYHIPVEDIIAMMKERMAAGYTGFTIRTTEFYPVDRLCEMARRIREEVPGDYRLGVNTGELTVEDCVRLKEAGYNSAYHTLHLREGIDTPFPPERRLQTMRAISESPLNLTCGVDPIGIEHTDEEIADIICTLRSFDHKHRFRQRSGLHTANRVIAFIAAHVNGHIAGPKPDALIIEFRYCGQRIFQFAVHNGGNIHQKRVQRTGTVRHIDLRSDHQVQRRLQLRKGQVTIPVCDFRSGQQPWLFLSKRRQLLSCLTTRIVVKVRPVVLEGRKFLCCFVSQYGRAFLHSNICDFYNGICVVRKWNRPTIHIHMAIQLKASHQLLRIHRSLEGCQQHYYQKKNDPTAIF